MRWELCLFLVLSSSAARDTINFDFAWRHFLGEPVHVVCTAPEKGINYGTGGLKIPNVASPEACCERCASTTCLCWDWNIQSHDCWLKTQQCDQKVTNAERYSGHAVVPPGPPAPARVEYNDSAWHVVNAPHDMLIVQSFDPNASEKQAFLPRGTGWYRKHFNVPAAWEGSSVWVYIEGAFHATTVWVNGVLAGPAHAAGYTSWTVRLDSLPGIQYGTENVIALHVDASTGTGWWYEGGGLMRRNYIVRADPLHIAPDSAWAHTSQQGDGAVLNTSALVVNDGNHSEAFQLSVTVVDEEGKTVATSTTRQMTVPAGKTVEADTSAALATAHLWSVQDPYLYTVHVAVLDSSGSPLDAVQFSTGVRTLSFDADTGLYVNNKHVKLRGFCDHSTFAVVGAAVPDRINLFRAQALRQVGGNSWRMAHNPPSVARLDFMDRLGMLAVDENRDYGGHVGQGGDTDETVTDELKDMADLVRRDRSHPSVIVWSFCNEVGCRNESCAKPFREVAKLWDPTRAVTQNHHGTDLSSDFLDVQGFSHRPAKDFAEFHTLHPKKPLMATECCSCMSQRGVDQDYCPNPKDGGCAAPANVSKGVFYNNNIGQCTADQVIMSDSPKYLTGTFVWSGFDYLGEARGWPQNTKCRGTIADVAGFTKETAYWLRSWWLSNISKADAGRPLDVDAGLPPWTVFIVESWTPPPFQHKSRTINVYSNAPTIRLELNGEQVGEQAVPFFGMTTFTVTYAPGNLTAVGVGTRGEALASHTIGTRGKVTGMVLSIDAPHPSTGTGKAVVLDGEDVAMIRATLLDASGARVPQADNNLTFVVVSGPGTIWGTHSGSPANLAPNHAPWTQAYHGLARAVVRSAADHATAPSHRRHLREIDLEAGVNTISVADPDLPSRAGAVSPAIVIEVTAVGLPTARISIPTTTDLGELPHAVASRAKHRAPSQLDGV